MSIITCYKCKDTIQSECYRQEGWRPWILEPLNWEWHYICPNCLNNLEESTMNEMPELKPGYTVIMYGETYDLFYDISTERLRMRSENHYFLYDASGYINAIEKIYNKELNLIWQRQEPRKTIDDIYIKKFAKEIADLQMKADIEYYKPHLENYTPDENQNEHAAWLIDQVGALKNMCIKLGICKQVYAEAYKIYDFRNSGKTGYTLKDGKIIKMEPRKVTMSEVAEKFGGPVEIVEG